MGEDWPGLNTYSESILYMDDPPFILDEDINVC